MICRYRGLSLIPCAARSVQPYAALVIFGVALQRFLLLLAIGGAICPVMVQNFIVQPNEISKEEQL